MKREEFTRQLEELKRQISLAIFSYEIFLAVSPTSEVVNILNRYRGFFHPVRNALYETVVMGFAKVFDNDTRTMSLKNLMKVAKEDFEAMLPNMTNEKAEELEQRLSQHDAVLTVIKRLRDHHFAHLDATPEPKPPLIKREIDQLSKTLKDVFNQLSQGHGGLSSSWEYQAERSAWETSEILRILAEDAQAQKAKADALMKALENDES